MIQDKKVGDTVYVHYTDPHIHSRLEVIEAVGRVFVKTKQGNHYNKHTGAERKTNLRRDFIPSCKAWPSKELYDKSIAHHIKFAESVKALSSLKPSDLSFEELNLIAAIIKNAKQG